MAEKRLRLHEEMERKYLSISQISHGQALLARSRRLRLERSLNEVPVSTPKIDIDAAQRRFKKDQKQKAHEMRLHCIHRKLRYHFKLWKLEVRRGCFLNLSSARMSAKIIRAWHALMMRARARKRQLKRVIDKLFIDAMRVAFEKWWIAIRVNFSIIYGKTGRALLATSSGYMPSHNIPLGDDWPHVHTDNLQRMTLITSTV